MNIEREIRAQIEKNKGLKLAVGEINNHLSILEGLLRNERDDVQKQVDEAYQRGLDAAWAAARKLFSSMAESDIEKVFPIEWNNGGFNALMNLQPQEAIAKLKAYEEKQKADDEIKVGDEVRHDRGWTAVVTSIDNVGFSVMDYNGEVASYSDISKFTKTGRHFDIPKILEEMKE